MAVESTELRGRSERGGRHGGSVIGSTCRIGTGRRVSGRLFEFGCHSLVCTVWCDRVNCRDYGWDRRCRDVSCCDTRCGGYTLTWGRIGRDGAGVLAERRRVTSAASCAGGHRLGAVGNSEPDDQRLWSVLGAHRPGMA